MKLRKFYEWNNEFCLSGKGLDLILSEILGLAHVGKLSKKKLWPRQKLSEKKLWPRQKFETDPPDLVSW